MRPFAGRTTEVSYSEPRSRGGRTEPGPFMAGRTVGEDWLIGAIA